MARVSRTLPLACLLFALTSHLSQLSAQSFTPTGQLNTSRWGQTATLLNDGTVLIVGGLGPGSLANPSGPFDLTASAEIYDPSTGTFAATGSLNVARTQHTATLLPNGEVLIAGGVNGSKAALSSAELYNPTNQSFTLITSPMQVARAAHTATLLQNGEVLLAGGGTGTSGSGVASAEIYNPAAGTFTSTGSMAAARVLATATLLGNGEVLVAGGAASGLPTAANLATAEIYNPTAGTFSSTGSMAHARSYHTATLLPNGNVLIAGGQDPSAIAEAEIYTTSAGTFAATGNLTVPRVAHTAALLANGLVLIAGGDSTSGAIQLTAETYNSSTGTFSSTGSMATARCLFTATVMPDATVLVAGGESTSGTPLPEAEIYTPSLSYGSLNPKYIVLGVVYAPPGTKSTVTYGISDLTGMSSSISSAFTGTTAVSTSETTKFGIFGTSFKYTYTESGSYAQESDTSTTNTVNWTNSTGDVYPGPASSRVGIDHDYDLVRVWLNPVVDVNIASTNGLIMWTGYEHNAADTYNPDDLDVVNIPVYCLRNYWSVDPGCNQGDLQDRIQRTWDTTGVGGLTPADYAAILTSDPFAENADFDPETDTSGRFDEQQGESLEFQPPIYGENPTTQTGGWQFQQTSQTGKGATDTKDVKVSVTTTQGTGSNFLTAILKYISTSTLSFEMNWQNKWSTIETNTTTQTANYSVTGPQYTDNYQGPTSFQVYKDNVYGTFMFYAPGYTPTSPGSIEFSPSSLSFATPIAVGSTSSAMTVTLTNDSILAMTMLSPVVHFSDPSFSLVSGSDNCSGKTIQPNATCTISVHFSPVAADVTANGNNAISATMFAEGNIDVAVEASMPVSGVGTPGPPSQGTIAIGGTEQSKAAGATAGKGTFTISGADRSYTMQVPCGPSGETCPVTIWDGGPISVTIDGTNYGSGYGEGSTAASIASALASSINAGSLCTATVSGATVTITAKTTGASTNYSLSGASSTGNPTYFSGPSFTVGTSGSALTGGSNGSTTYDTGTITATVNGVQASVSWGQSSTAQSLASSLDTALEAAASSFLKASVSSNSVSLASTALGVQTTNWPISVTVTDTAGFSTPSFTATKSGMSGGTN